MFYLLYLPENWHCIAFFLLMVAMTMIGKCFDSKHYEIFLWTSVFGLEQILKIEKETRRERKQYAGKHFKCIVWRLGLYRREMLRQEGMQVHSFVQFRFSYYLQSVEPCSTYHS